MIFPVAVMSSGQPPPLFAGLVEEDVVIADAGAGEERPPEALLRALELVVPDPVQRQARGVQGQQEGGGSQMEPSLALAQVAGGQQPVGELLH
jgi:hypothetical protein